MSNLQYLRLVKISALVLSILLTVMNLSWAATRTDFEEQNRKARKVEQDRSQRKQGKDIFLQKGKQNMDTVELPDEVPSFTINKIKIEGCEAAKFPWVCYLVNKYQGQKIGWQGINNIVKMLTNAFIDRGYITTRVLIPPQDISSGVLTLQVIPGTIKEIRLLDPNVRADWKSAFPARAGDILNLRDLEQGLEQMKRVPSQDVEMQLLPGDKPGESIVEIRVSQKKPWRTVLTVDDSGSKATGKLQASGKLMLDNLFGINDLFDISFNSDAERNGCRHGTRGESFSFSVPQGYWTYSLSSSSNKHHQTIDSLGTPIVSSGRTLNLELKAEKLVYRDQKRKTNLGVSLIKSSSKSYVDDTEIEIQRQTTSAAKLAVIHRQYNGQTVVDHNLAYKRGVPWFGAQADPADSNKDQPTTKYNIWTLDTSLTTPVTIGKTMVSYNAVFHMQYTKNLLYASEFLSIGNRYTVRGFDGEQTLAAENGWYLRNEISKSIKESNSEAYLALDVGKIGGVSAKQALGKSIAGSTVGMRGNLAGAHYDIFIGIPIKHPAGMKAANHVFGFQLIYQL